MTDNTEIVETFEFGESEEKNTVYRVGDVRASREIKNQYRFECVMQFIHGSNFELLEG